ncbi:MAG: hypothetical protein KGI28_07525 [Thaumarchaeota archaeon]|nr:hypothetical protein [Nitrososphaerota archaeon]
MSLINRQEKVRIIGVGEIYDKTYIIKDVKKIRKGGLLYLLKSLEDNSVFRLFYENNESHLERV